MKKYSKASLFLISLLFYVVNLHASDERILSTELNMHDGFMDIRYQTDAQLMSSTFIYGETQITMEVLRGEPTPELMLINDPDAPPYTI